MGGGPHLKDTDQAHRQPRRDKAKLLWLWVRRLGATTKRVVKSGAMNQDAGKFPYDGGPNQQGGRDQKRESNQRLEGDMSHTLRGGWQSKI
jgi:hypothetical protein